MAETFYHKKLYHFAQPLSIIIGKLIFLMKNDLKIKRSEMNT